MKVSYHPNLGYPVKINFDWIIEAIDDEQSISINHVKLDSIIHSQAVLSIADLTLIDDGLVYNLQNVQITENFLEIAFQESSSCSSSYYQLYISTDLLESLPPQLNTKIVRLPQTDAVCDFPVNYTARFYLDNLMEHFQQNKITLPVILNIDNLKIQLE